MRIVLVAGCLVVLAGLALGTALKPMAQVKGVPVSAPGIGVPMAPLPALGQPAQAAPAKQSAPARSILKGAGEARDPGPPSVAAPVFATPPAPARSDIAPKAESVAGQCVVKPQAKTPRGTPIAALCPPLPARPNND
jgi:hypothetical protein